MNKYILLITLVMLGAGNVMAQDIALQEQELIFVKEYHQYIKRNQHKWHRKILHNSEGRIHKTDALLYVPHFCFKKQVSWDVDDCNNNQQYACWQSFSIQNGCLDEFFKKESGLWKELYSDATWNGVVKYILYPFKDPELFELVNAPGVEGIFKLCDIPGYFVIIDGRIKFYQWSNDTLEPQKDAIESLKTFFTDKTFMPVWHLYQGERFPRLKWFWRELWFD